MVSRPVLMAYITKVCTRESELRRPVRIRTNRMDMHTAIIASASISAPYPEYILHCAVPVWSDDARLIREASTYGEGFELEPR